MKYHHLISLILLLKIILLHNLTMGQTNYKIYGHRGCRGLYPENTITGFEKAIELGVDGIEIDVVVNKDSQLIISHEPYIDTNYCVVLKSSSENLNIYKMNLDEIRKIDCGSKVLNRFPLQEKTVEINLNKLFDEIKNNFNNTKLSFENKKEMHLKGRPLALKRTFENVIQNGLTYGKNVYVNLDKSVNRVLILVEDDGPGIPEDQFKNVFKPFFRMDKSRSLNQSGVGLGLAIVEDIINSHGGNIQLGRSKLKGLQVKISLPF